MKGIIIRDCLNCPFSKIKNPCNNGGILVCELGKDLNCRMKLIRKMISIDETIPDWCRLKDLEETVERAILEYGINIKND